MEEWPEGPEADPAAARERYERDLRADRQKRRRALGPRRTARSFSAGAAFRAGAGGLRRVAGWIAGLVAPLFRAPATSARWRGLVRTSQAQKADV